MNKIKNIFLIGLILFVAVSCSKTENLEKVSLHSLDAKGCYSYGRITAYNDKTSSIVVSGSYFAKGILDSTGTTFSYSYDEINAIINQYGSQYITAGVLGEPGEKLLTVEEINKLEKPSTLQDEFSYVWGYLNSPWRYSSVTDISLETFISGYFSALYDTESLLTDAEIEENFSKWSQKIVDAMNEESTKLAEENLKDAEKFLEENKAKEGIQLLSGGTQLEKLVAIEEGISPQSGDSVVVDYKLSLLDGTVADQGQDVTFSLDSLIPGFVEAVKNMKVGESAIAYIPPAQGYGSANMGTIGPNSLLVFEITLKDIK